MIHIFGNFIATFILLSVYALAMAIGTFIENDYGVMSARALIYQASWFEILHIALGVNLALIIYRYKMFKKEKLPQFIFHFAFLIILIGAGVTRYFGYEGIIHIREGKSENRMISSEPYLQISAIANDLTKKEKFEYLKRFSATPFGWNNFDIQETLKNGKNIEATLVSFLPSKDRNGASKIVIDFKYDGQTEQITLEGGENRKGFEQRFQIKDMMFSLEWGSKVVELPFYLKLTDFIMENYPGSSMPSSYKSEVVVEDKPNNVQMPYSIFMNNTLNYGGYRFFQSSYDPDEQGTVLSVNNDPGKIPTYIGYILLTRILQ